MNTEEGWVSGIKLLRPSGTNSTFFTECCSTAICEDEKCCPSCSSLVIGHGVEGGPARHRARWRHATSHWKPQQK